MTTCRHCRAKQANRPRGLCWDCYYAPGVRALYASTSKYAPVRDREEPPQGPRPERRPGEPLHRCLWCLKYRCAEPLRLCGSCQADCDQLLARLPAGERPGDE